MRTIRVGILSVFLASQFFGLPVAQAVSSGVVISQVQTGGSGIGTAGQEFVEIYNNSTTDINVTNWYITYSSASDVSQSILYRLATPNAQTALWLKAKSYATFVSPDFKTATGIAGDGTFTYTNGMAQAGGHVRVFDGSNTEIDKVAWGTTTVTPPELTASAPVGGKALQRVGPGVLQDTDVPSSDFSIITPTMHVASTGLYEVVTVVDVCPNLAGSQATMPIGYAVDSDGNCQPDSCLNLAGLQVSVPDHYDSDVNGNCTPHDECDNLPDIQNAIPVSMIRTNSNDCSWNIKPLQLTEILPNAVGSDTGNEFIEIHNPTSETIDLSLYSIKTGSISDKTYAFPAGATIAPGEYRAFSDSAMKFTLVNTSSRVVLGAIEGSILDDTGVYDSPADGESWAYIGDHWQYTNQPTPGAANQASFITDDAATADTSDTGLVPCPEGKYRNPLTNRCRLIETDIAVLAVCDADQYRNPDTGRCRKIATTSVTPCKDGQYRSEETNRCRNITTASTQTPCKDTQYRSEETGRCRNLPASTVPNADFAVQPVKDTSMAFVGWWALGGAGLLAVGYAGWEWRQELSMIFRNSLNRFR